MIDKNSALAREEVSILGVKTTVSTMQTVATVSVVINLVILTNWVLGKYFNIHIFNMFGGDATTTEV
jgi:hypothetical protein